jgi:hypothetical protein
MNTYSFPALAQMRRWVLREPLMHFIALGALIFFTHGMLGTQPVGENKRIEVSMADVERLRSIAMQQWGKEPDAQTMRDLVQSFVREEVLYREALASGLDRDDVIVRRRLAQKMEFLAHEDVRTPTESDLRAYFASHPQQFAEGAQLDVDQVIFDPARRGASTDAALRSALEHLRAGRAVEGDSVMQPTRLVHQDLQQLQRDYGQEFAQTLSALPDGTWSGPVRSAMGLHLVRVHHHAARLPSFEDVRARVLAELTQSRVEQARTDAYARALARYIVITPTSGIEVSNQVSQVSQL